MTTLKTQLENLREQFQLKQQVQSLEDVFEQYRTIRDGLLDVTEPLQKARNQLKVLENLPDVHASLDFSQDSALFYGVKSELGTLTERFKESGEKIEQTGLREALILFRSVYSGIDEKIYTAWRTFIGDLEAKATLESVLLEQQKTLGDLITYNSYRTARDNFNRQKLSGPDNLSVVKNLQKYSEEMVALKSTMVRDAPEDVLRFFEALDRHHQASLTLLTAEVIAWLEEKSLIPAFNVTRKRMI
ncbi:TPA: hypothetical protein PXJ58_001942 [Yersinia enterocolitica]|uniref:protein DpdI n=1 Tax=Yersinia intermedia TaxID=631 RepID=UPI001CFF3C68|nr:protein DpdI [Yersinia intermedia]MCB5298800.1 hypothetical protein [Yersinia intermedia]HDL6737985.1 hypothetical protein [Yersinia enterocolitica]